MESITYSFPVKVPSLNEYINACRRNKYAGGKMKKDLSEAIRSFLPSQPKMTLTPPFDLHFVFYEQTKRRDKDNVISMGVKGTLDAFQEHGILGNDNWVWIETIKADVLLAKDCIKEPYRFDVTITERRKK